MIGFVDMTPEVVRATAWRVRVSGGYVGPGMRRVEHARDAQIFDGHDAAVNLALDVAESFGGAVVEPAVPDQKEHHQ